MARASTSVLAGGLALFGVGMLGLSFAAVPLYRMFCQATGFDGTPNTEKTRAPGAMNTEAVEVRFDANVSPSLPWKFIADQARLVTVLGQDRMATYSGINTGERVITGVATYNISPEKAARYFHKTACFCFNEQSLKPGERAVFPISFWVDPAIRSDPATRDVRSVTLSYTFFRSIDDAVRNGGLVRAGSHVGGTRVEERGSLSEAQF